MDENNSSGTYLILTLITFFALVAVAMFSYWEMDKYTASEESIEVPNPFP